MNPTPQSETPLTDKLDLDLQHDILQIKAQGGLLSDIVEHVGANLFKHARTLERELGEAKKHALNDMICCHHNDKERTDFLGGCPICLAKVAIQQRDERFLIQQELSGAKETLDIQREHIEALKEELSQVRGELAHALDMGAQRAISAEQERALLAKQLEQLKEAKSS